MIVNFSALVPFYLAALLPYCLTVVLPYYLATFPPCFFAALLPCWNATQTLPPRGERSFGKKDGEFSASNWPYSDMLVGRSLQLGSIFLDSSCCCLVSPR